MKKFLGLFLSSVIAVSTFAPHRPAHALLAPSFKWNATTLAPNSQQPLASLITTNAKGIRTWRATGSCVRNGPILTVIGTKVCRLQLSIGSRGKPPRLTRSRAFRIRAVSADASGTLLVTPSRFWSLRHARSLFGIPTLLPTKQVICGTYLSQVMYVVAMYTH